MKIINKISEKFEVLFDDGEYCVVKNCKTKDYSFGLWRDFYDLYYFPINQCCLTLKEIKDRLNSFIKIAKKYFKTEQERGLYGQIPLYNKMLEALQNE